MNTKTLAILAAVSGAAVVAAVVVTRSDKSIATTDPSATGAPARAGNPAFAPPLPDLASRINDVASITVQSAQSESTVEQVDGQWRLKEKSGYPVDAAKAREVVLSLAALHNFDPKTSRADLFKSIGVDDVPAPKKPDPAAAAATPPATPEAAPDAPRTLLLTLKDKSGLPVTSVIVGNTKYAQSPGPQGIYLRKPGDTQSWYAEGKLDVPRDALTWVNNEFADIGRDRVRSVLLTPRDAPEAERITVTKDKPAEGAFAVQGVPEGKQLKDVGLSETIVSGLVKATFEDVNKADSVDFSGNDDTKGKPGPRVDIRTWDGLLVHVDTAEFGGRQWWKLSAAPDPDPYKEAPAPAPAAAPPAVPPAAADGLTPPPPAPPAPLAPADPKPRRTAEEVKKEVDELNARWSGWVYSPYSYKSSAFTKKLSDELKDPAPPDQVPLVAPPTGFPGMPPSPNAEPPFGEPQPNP